MLIFADKPRIKTISYVNNFFNDTEPSDSVIPAALDDTKIGQPSSISALDSLPQ
jgi:hypothetical protein